MAFPRGVIFLAIQLAQSQPRPTVSKAAGSLLWAGLLGSSLLLATFFQAPEALAKDLVDKVGNYLECRENPAASPYCADPEIRAQVYEQFRLREKLEQVELSVERANVVGAQMRGVEKILMFEVKSCKADVECIKSVVSAATDRMYDISEIERTAPLTESEVAAFGAAERAKAAEYPERNERIRELDDAYAKEWAIAQNMIQKTGKRLPRFRFSAPDKWAQKWSRKCRGDAMCLEDKKADLEKMVAARDEAMAKVYAAKRKASEREFKAMRAEQAARAEDARREAEDRRREEATQKMRAAAADEARDKLSPNSMLYHVFFEDFAEADKIAARIADKDIYEPGYSGFDRMVVPQARGSVRSMIMNNRRNLVVAAYALTRLDRLGNCGEPVELITRKKTEEQVWRNGYGVVVRRSPAQYARFYTPAKFAAHTRKTPFERGAKFFIDEVDAIGNCNSGLRLVIEDRLIDFADWRP